MERESRLRVDVIKQVNIVDWESKGLDMRLRREDQDDRKKREIKVFFLSKSQLSLYTSP